MGAAKQLAHDDRYQFQWWALSLINGAKPVGGKSGSSNREKKVLIKEWMGKSISSMVQVFNKKG